MKINEEAKYLVKPIVLMAVLAVLIVLVLFFGASQYVAISTKTAEINSVQKQLSQKASVLESIPDKLSGDTNFLSIVLPSRTSVLYALSQIKTEAAKNNLVLTNIESSSPVVSDDGISTVYISLDIEGTNTSLFSMLKAIPKMLPIISIDKVKTIGSGSDISKTTLTVKTYSSELPKTLPALSTTSSSFTDEEIKLLDELSRYSLPSFVETGAKPAVPKADPFSN